MQILLANAKIMNSQSKVKPLTQPLFQSIANDLAMDMAQLDINQLSHQLDCNLKLASENWQRYQNFFSAEKMPAIMAYNGQAYKHLKAASLTPEALQFAQNHLWITCFLYGLLRPMDGIVPYRMEHCVELPVSEGRPMNQFWKDKLTDTLIASVKADDGILVHLSTEEYEHLFDWKRVCQEVRVIQPLFLVDKGDKLKTVVVYAKSCRGAMVRYLLQHQITQPDEILNFSYEGFLYTDRYGNPDNPYFVLES